MASEIKGGNIWKNDILWMEEDSIEILQLMVEKYPMYPIIYRLCNHLRISKVAGFLPSTVCIDNNIDNILWY
jgi:hypothetical protein